MKNVTIKVEGKKMTIEVDLSKEQGTSSSGKSTIIATTEGNQLIPEANVTIGMNVYRKK